MYYRIVINSILLLFLVIGQISFVSGLPLGLANLNLIIVCLIFILSFGGLDRALWSALTLGFLLDVFSFSYFGLYIVCLALTVLVVHFLLNNFFTNRSLYSVLALVALATLVYEICLFASDYIISLFNNIDLLVGSGDFWLGQLIQLGLNCFLAILLFYAFHFLSRRLSPAFLFKSKK